VGQSKKQLFSEPFSQRSRSPETAEVARRLFRGIVEPLGRLHRTIFGFLEQFSIANEWFASEIAVSRGRHGILREVNEGLSMLYVRSSGSGKMP
jgi:hypothetical protein